MSTVVACSTQPTTKKVYDKVGPAPFTYTDCMRINGNETFCLQYSTPDSIPSK